MNEVKYGIFAAMVAVTLLAVTGCKTETTKTETTVTDPADAPATVEKKETTEEKQ